MIKILLVDDENINHILARRILSGEYQLVSAYSGEEALSRSDLAEFDLVLLDILMPGTDGFQTFRSMRENGANSDLNVIFLTAKEDESLKEQCLKEGARAYITKPFSPQALVRSIREVLCQSREN